MRKHAVGTKHNAWTVDSPLLPTCFSLLLPTIKHYTFVFAPDRNLVLNNYAANPQTREKCFFSNVFLRKCPNILGASPSSSPITALAGFLCSRDFPVPVPPAFKKEQDSQVNLRVTVCQRQKQLLVAWQEMAAS